MGYIYDIKEYGNTTTTWSRWSKSLSADGYHLKGNVIEFFKQNDEDTPSTHTIVAIYNLKKVCITNIKEITKWLHQ